MSGPGRVNKKLASRGRSWGWAPEGQLACLTGWRKPFLPAGSLCIFPGALCLIRTMVAMENETVDNRDEALLGVTECAFSRE